MPVKLTVDSLRKKPKRTWTAVTSLTRSTNTATRTVTTESPGKKPEDAAHQRNGSQLSSTSLVPMASSTERNLSMPVKLTVDSLRKKPKRTWTAVTSLTRSTNTATRTVTTESPGKKPEDAVHQRNGSQLSS